MSKELEALETFNYIMNRCIDEDSYIIKFPLGIQKGTTFGEDMEKAYKVINQALNRLESIDNANPSEALECLDKMYDNIESPFPSDKKLYDTIKQALQRLDKYEQVLGDGRLTDRNFKNTTLDLDSCKPYLRLGQLEDIYEEGK